MNLSCVLTFLVLVPVAYAQVPTPFQEDTLGFINAHRARLRTDISEILDRDAHQSGEALWVKGANEQILQMKRESLRILDEAERKLRQGLVPLTQPARTMHELTAITGSVGPMQHLKLPHQAASGLDIFLTTPFRFAAMPPPHVKRIEVHPLGIDFLRAIGDQEIPDLIAKYRDRERGNRELDAALAKNDDTDDIDDNEDMLDLRETKDRTEVLESIETEDLDELLVPSHLRKKSASSKARRERRILEFFNGPDLPALPYLSRLIIAAERLTKAYEDLPEVNAEIAESLPFMTIALGSDMLQEIYVRPDELSPAWIRLVTYDSDKPVSERASLKQIAYQKTLVDEDHKVLTSEERQQHWLTLRDKLIVIYHGESFRTFAVKKVNDRSENEYGKDVVQRFGVKSYDAQLPDLIDHSEKFQQPRLQGMSNACVAFSVISDMETFTQKPLSTGFAYSLYSVRNLSSSDRNKFYAPVRRFAEYATGRTGERLINFLDKGANSYDLLQILRTNGVPPEANFPFDESSWLIEDLNKVDERLSVVGGFLGNYEHPSEQQLKAILAAGVAPIVQYKYSARTIVEDWVRPEPISELGHAIVVVGYGEAIDPFDLVRKPYFLVRDSFTTSKIHYRIAANELIPLIDFIAKVTEVKALDKNVVYPEEFPKRIK